VSSDETKLVSAIFVVVTSGKHPLSQFIIGYHYIVVMIDTDNVLPYQAATFRDAHYTPPTPTRLICEVESRRRCVHNSLLVGDSLDESEQVCQQRSRVASCRRCERTRRQS